jgi:DNA-binding MarR family transcriptional regulator
MTSTVLDKLLWISEMFQHDVDRAFADTPLSRARVRLLWLLYHGGPVTQRTLAEELQVSARNISGLVDALVEAGYARRSPHPDDRRATLVELTDVGAKAMADMAAAHDKLSRTLIQSVEPADRVRLERALDAIGARLASLIAEHERAA